MLTHRQRECRHVAMALGVDGADGEQPVVLRVGQRHRSHVSHVGDFREGSVVTAAQEPVGSEHEFTVKVCW